MIGPVKPKKIPMRRCVACHQLKDKRELIRVVRSPEGEIFIDPTGKKNGRGAYLCRNSDCIAKARKAKSLSRDLKTEIPAEVFDQLLEQYGGKE